MSRGRLELTAARGRVEAWVRAGLRAFDRFRATRLYVQIWVSAFLLALSALVVRAEWPPLRHVRQAIAWTVLHDYDFAGQAHQAQAWAEEHGGWLGAGEHVFRVGQAHLNRWISKVGGRPL